MEETCSRNPKNGGKRRKTTTNNNNQDEEDRISLLFDPLLIEILSLLPIQSAAATSALSRRWRHLWTQVTSLRFNSGKDFSAVDQILPQLTSPLIRALVIPTVNCKVRPRERKDGGKKGLLTPAIYTCFGHIRLRNDVERIEVSAWTPPEVKLPAWVFQCQSLLSLNLPGYFNFDLIATNFNLPNLKNICLKLCCFATILTGTIFTSCPLLETLCLEFPYPLQNEQHLVNISAPHLKTLNITLRGRGPMRLKFVINAPKLLQLVTHSWSNQDYYSFVTIPSALVKAQILLSPDRVVSAPTSEVPDLVQGITSVRSLDLRYCSRMINYLGCMDDGALPIFRNLTLLELDFGYKGGSWKDLLLSLRCFPNLEVLKVLEYPTVKGDLSWLVSLPTYSLSKLKILEIKELPVYDSDKLLLGYILSNAFSLERLSVDVSVEARSKHMQLWKEYEFCETLFKLPRSSFTCQIEFHGAHINASSNAFANRVLTCQLLY